MYERVLIVGVDFVKEEDETKGTVGRVRVQCLNERGKSRVLQYELAERDGGWVGAHPAGYRAAGSMSRLLAAAGIQSDAAYDEMLAALTAGEMERAIRAEGRLESRVMEIVRAVAGTPGPVAEHVGADVVALLVGRVIRIDWIQMGPFGRLAEQPANVLPSRSNGTRMFGGKPVAQVVGEWEAAVRRNNEVPDLQALDAVADDVEQLINGGGGTPTPGPARL